MSHLIETGKLTMEDLEEAKETLRKLSSAHPETALLNNLPPSLKLWRDKLRHTQIVILEIPQCIPAVTIFAFLDLVQKISFLDGH